jgi:VWFA-related protein
MLRRALLACLALLPTAVLAQAPPPSPQPSPSPVLTFPAEVEQVVVDVVVSDKKGAAVPALRREDFVVTEDDKPQELVSFEAVSLPPAPTAPEVTPPRPQVSTNASRPLETTRTFVVVFDDIHMTQYHAQRAKAAVKSFLETGVSEGDRVTLIATSGAAWWSTRMNGGRDELLTLLKRFDGRLYYDFAPDRITEYEAMRIHIFNDKQIEERVSRRFETYGAHARGNSQSTGDTGLGAEGDPLVRGRAAEIYYQAVTRNRITLQVMQRALEALAGVRGRKSMVLVSQGFIFDPNLDEFRRVVQASRRGNAAVYFLDSRGLGGLPVEFSAEFGPALPDQDIGATLLQDLEASAGSESIASDSGGFTVKNNNDLQAGIKRIADESRTYYLLGYNPSNLARDGRFRKVQVKLAGDRGKGLKVRARKGYYAPLDASAQAGKDKDKGTPDSKDPDIQAALDSPYDKPEIPMRMAAYSFDETLLGKAKTVVIVDLDLRAFAFEEKEGRFHDTVEFLLVVAHRETGEFFRYDQKIDLKLLPATRDKVFKSWLPLARDFELPSGGYQAKMVVRDKNNRRVGTIVHEFVVPDLAGLRTSTPVLSDVVETPEKAAPRAVPLARRTFLAGVPLYCQFEVFGMAKAKETGVPRVSAGYVVRKADGTELVRVDPTVIQPTSLGRVSRLVGSKLEGSVPGEYDFELTVTDEITGKTLVSHDPFVLVDPASPDAPPLPPTPQS